MTFQVALVGTDGLVVGSDRRVTYVTNSPGGPSIQRLETFKFCRSDDDSIICAYAGGPSALNIGREVASEGQQYVTASDTEWERGVLGIGDKMERQKVLIPRDEIIVVRPSIPAKFWLLGKPSAGPASMEAFETYLCTGSVSTARFIIQELWRPMPVRNLRTLAHLAISYAAKGNPTFIGGGIDILSITNGKPEWGKFPAESTQTDSFSNSLREAFEKIPPTVMGG